MPRTGPGYVESEEELFDDLERKRKQDQLSKESSQAFIELYEFATEIGDRVLIKGAKNANFKMKVSAHRGNYRKADPSVFTANVGGKVKIWPARMPIDHGYFDAVPWDEQDYLEFERSFQVLKGVPRDENEAPFEALVSEDNLGRFKNMVERFVTACREKSR